MDKEILTDAELHQVLGGNSCENILSENNEQTFEYATANCSGGTCKNSCTPGCSAGCVGGCIQSSGAKGYDFLS